MTQGSKLIGRITVVAALALLSACAVSPPPTAGYGDYRQALDRCHAGNGAACAAANDQWAEEYNWE